MAEPCSIETVSDPRNDDMILIYFSFWSFRTDDTAEELATYNCIGAKGAIVELLT